MLAILLIALIWPFGIYIAVEDFKTRLISVWAIVVYTAVAFCIYFLDHSIKDYILNLAFCCCYFVTCLVLLKLVFFLRRRNFEKITGSKMGMGDVALILVTGGLLIPEVLVFFFTAVFVISLPLQLVFFKKNPAIPLAGFLTLGYSAYITYLYCLL